MCPECAKGELEVTFINAGNISTIEQCHICEYRKVTRINEK
jgi:transcription elongation factor Elf1